MSSAKASLAPGKQSPRRVGSRTSAYAVADSAGHYTSEQSLRSIAWLENGGSWTLSMPQAAESPLYFAFCCFPPASPPLPPGPGKQKTAPKDRCNPMIFLMKSGAGEGIRTLDPNLGKVTLLAMPVGITFNVEGRRHRLPPGPPKVRQTVPKPSAGCFRPASAATNALSDIC